MEKWSMNPIYFRFSKKKLKFKLLDIAYQLYCLHFLNKKMESKLITRHDGCIGSTT